jgi:hypothetical protein
LEVPLAFGEKRRKKKLEGAFGLWREDVGWGRNWIVGVLEEGGEKMGAVNSIFSREKWMARVESC